MGCGASKESAAAPQPVKTPVAAPREEPAVAAEKPPQEAVPVAEAGGKEEAAAEEERPREDAAGAEQPPSGEAPVASETTPVDAAGGDGGNSEGVYKDGDGDGGDDAKVEQDNDAMLKRSIKASESLYEIQALLREQDKDSGYPGRVVSWGLGAAVGRGKPQSESGLFEPGTPDEIKDKLAVALGAGHAHSVVVLEDGTAVVAGTGERGLLGLGSGVTESDSFKEIPFITNAKKVVCAKEHSMVFCEGGALYSWGSADDGKLGHGKREHDCWEPTEIMVFKGKRVVDIACGNTHSAAVTDDGALWTWGSNSVGELGLGDTASRRSPMAVGVLGDKVAVQVACGDNHTLVLTDAGVVYAMGSNKDGQLGIGSDVQETSEPTLVKELESFRVVQIIAANNHSICLTDDGVVFAWGSNSDNQLGIAGVDKVDTPRLVKALMEVRVLRICTSQTSAAVVDFHGAVYAWGKHYPPTPENIEELSSGAQVVHFALGLDHGIISVEA